MERLVTIIPDYILLLTILICIVNLVIYLKDLNQQSTALQYVNILILSHCSFILLLQFLIRYPIDLELYSPFLLFYGPFSYLLIRDLISSYKSKRKLLLWQFLPTTIIALGYLLLQIITEYSPKDNYAQLLCFLLIVGLQMITYAFVGYYTLRSKKAYIPRAYRYKYPLTIYGLIGLLIVGVTLTMSFILQLNSLYDKQVNITIVSVVLLLSSFFIYKTLSLDKKKNHKPLA
ncbi:hypothetical protein ACYSNM_08035 [Myroides sp. LJL116]